MALSSGDVDAFVAKYDGKYVNVDGAYGAQCWDLWEQYCRELIGVQNISTQLSSNPGYAVALWDGYSGNGASVAFDAIQPDQAPRKGDVAIWQSGQFYYPLSHVAIVLADAGSNLYLFSQNSTASLPGNPYPGQSTGPSSKQYLPKAGLAGYLRPKALNGVPVPPPVTYSPRLAISDASGHVSVKEGNLYSGWTSQETGAKGFHLSANRIGVIDQWGLAKVKDGNLSASWVNQLPNAAKIRVTDTRVGVLATNGDLWIKEGSLYSGWTQVNSGVSDFDISGNRIATIGGGVVSVKEGDLYQPWVNQISNAAKVRIDGDRIAVLQTSGVLQVKAGNLWTGWVQQASAVSDFDVAGTRIGIVGANGMASVKEGDLYTSWVNQLPNAAKVRVTQSRICVVGTNGDVYAKDGNLYDSWIKQTGGVSDAEVTN